VNHIHNILKSNAKVIDLIGISILIYGFLKLLIKYVLIEIKNIKQTAIKKTPSIRCELGMYILLALDFLIASDIIHTISELRQEQLIELAVMIALKVSIGHFLGKEINEIQNTTL
jgi:uncharacterized membrane protein